MYDVMRALGVDYGTVRTGIAASDPMGIMAIGVGNIKAKGLHELAQKIADAASERECEVIVIGLPINMNGTRSDKCDTVELLGQYISEYTDIPVEFFDERMSTMVAHRYLNATDTRGAKRKERVDTLAAEIILQNYLDSKRKG